MNDHDREAFAKKRARLEKYIAKKTAALSHPLTREDVEAWWVRCRSKTKLTTMQTYANAFRRVDLLSNGKAFREMNKHDAARIMAEVQNSSAPGSAACISQCMIAFFRWLKADEQVPHSLWAAWRYHARLGELQVVTVQERDALLEAAAFNRDERFVARNQALVWCWWDSGYRKGEMLDWSHKNLAFLPDGTCRVQPDADLDDRVVGGLKTGIRPVYLGPAAKALQLLVTLCPGGPEDPVFTNLRKSKFQGRRLSRNEAGRQLGELCKLAGVRHIKPHLFRHTAVTRDSELGASEDDLNQKYWTRGSTMGRIYKHRSEGRLAKMARQSLGITDDGAPKASSKPCPFCAETIQLEAVKCRHCGEWLTKEQRTEVPR